MSQMTSEFGGRPMFHSRPEFDSPEHERTHVKRRLAAAFRLFAQHGLNEGLAGHITVRDPIAPDHFWVNPIGVSFRLMKVSDLVLADAEGNVVEGRWQIGRAAFAIHSRVHTARPGRARGGPRTRPLRQGMVNPRPPGLSADTGSVCVLRGPGGSTAGTKASSSTLVRASRSQPLGPHKACIMRNHGLLTVGATVDEAAWWFISLEGICHVQLMAEAAGTPVPLTDDEARSNTGAGWDGRDGVAQLPTAIRRHRRRSTGPLGLAGSSSHHQVSTDRGRPQTRVEPLEPTWPPPSGSLAAPSRTLGVSATPLTPDQCAPRVSNPEPTGKSPRLLYHRASAGPGENLEEDPRCDSYPAVRSPSVEVRTPAPTHDWPRRWFRACS